MTVTCLFVSTVAPAFTVTLKVMFWPTAGKISEAVTVVVVATAAAAAGVVIVINPAKMTVTSNATTIKENNFESRIIVS